MTKNESKATSSTTTTTKPHTSSSRPPNCLTEAELEELQEAFNAFDTDNTGTIDPQEIKVAMESLGLESKSQMMQEMVSNLDKHHNNNGKNNNKKKNAITFDEFLDLVTFKMTHDFGSKEELQQVFALFDDDNAGYITLEKLKKVALELGETNMSEEELKGMIDRADTDHDGKVTAEDFYAILRQSWS